MMSRRKYDYYGFFYEPTKPIEVKEGLRARSQRGAFAKNWWATQWIRSLERLLDSGRLSRGRGYARKGQVLSIEETRGGIAARVQGSRPKPYKVSIRIKPLSDAEWEQVIDALAEQAIFTAQLLSGEMPAEIETAFRAAGVNLFPTQVGDLTTDCSCPDWANPCKHIAATHFLLGERFDEDPFLLFRLRGRTQEQLLQALRQRRTEQEADLDEAETDQQGIVPLEETIDNFWNLGSPLEGVSIRIQEPAVEMSMLKRLGEAAFVPQPGILTLLQPAYQAVMRSALEAAFQDRTEEAA